MRKPNSNDLVINLLLWTGAGLVIWAFFIFAVTVIKFALGYPLDISNLYLASLATVGILLLDVIKNYKSFWTWLCGLVALVCAGSIIWGGVWFSRQFLDLSFDGMAYHTEAMIQLKNGWNPVRQQNIEPLFGLSSPWVNGYTKAAWINSLVLVSLTENFEDGKAFNLILMVTSGLLALAALLSLKLWKWPTASLIAATVTLNLVTLLQLNSYNLDGQVYSLLICLIASFILVHTRNSVFTRIIMVASFILLSNVKLAGLVYACLAMATFLAYLLIVDKPVLKNFLTACLAALLAVFVFGFNPYVTNLINYKHPLYPVMGTNKVEAFSQNIPLNYLDKSNAEIFVSSLFFKSDAVYEGPDDVAVMKWPFTFTSDEFEQAMVGIGPKKGGFGPLFSSALVISLILLTYLFVTRLAQEKDEPEEKDEHILAAYFLIFTIIISCLLYNNSSYARIVPQLWLLPVAIVYLALLENKWWLKTPAYLVLLILIGNSLASVYFNFNYQLAATRQTKLELQAYREVSQNSPLIVYLDKTTGVRQRLDNFGVKYELTDTWPSCENYGQWSSLTNTPLVICKPEAQTAE
jgi:hypothetical protein